MPCTLAWSCVSPAACRLPFPPAHRPAFFTAPPPTIAPGRHTAKPPTSATLSLLSLYAATTGRRDASYDQAAVASYDDMQRLMTINAGLFDNNMESTCTGFHEDKSLRAKIHNGEEYHFDGAATMPATHLSHVTIPVRVTCRLLLLFLRRSKMACSIGFPAPRHKKFLFHVACTSCF